MKSLIATTKHRPKFTNLNFSPHLPPPPNLLIYQSSTRTHCVPKIPVQTQAIPTCRFADLFFINDIIFFQNGDYILKLNESSKNSTDRDCTHRENLR